LIAVGGFLSVAFVGRVAFLTLQARRFKKSGVGARAMHAMKQYIGPFDKEMSRKEAALILNVK
jgi:hypothetical protein